ncbi:hypothetical protein [Spirosoma humi]
MDILYQRAVQRERKADLSISTVIALIEWHFSSRSGRSEDGAYPFYAFPSFFRPMLRA